MRVTRVTATPIALPLRRKDMPLEDTVIVEVTTDDGLVGIGEAPPILGADMTKALIDSAAEDCVGVSPFDVNRILKTLYARHNLTHVHPHAANWALNGIEVALWDLVGKACQKPLYEIWGGAFRTDILFYGYIARQSPEQMREEAQRLGTQGFQTLYTKVGLGRDEDIAAVAAIREGAPSRKVRIRIDANQSWAPAEAITMIKELEPYGLEFVDQPVIMFNLDALIRVKEAVSVPIASHESGWTMYELLNVIKRQAVDVVHIDPFFDLGLTGARVSAGIAEAAGVPAVAHIYGLSGVGFTALLHLIAATPNFTLANQEGNYSLIDDDVIVDGPLPFHGNTVRVPRGPGLGVTLDRDRLSRCAETYQREIGSARASRALHDAFYASMYLRTYLEPTMRRVT